MYDVSGLFASPMMQRTFWHVAHHACLGMRAESLANGQQSRPVLYFASTKSITLNGEGVASPAMREIEGDATVLGGPADGLAFIATPRRNRKEARTRSGRLLRQKLHPVRSCRCRQSFYEAFSEHSLQNGKVERLISRGGEG